MATTWNPADKSSVITLSNGNLTATSNDSSIYNFVRADAGKQAGASTGKLYFEILCGGSAGKIYIGLAELGFPQFSYLGATSSSCSYSSAGVREGGGVAYQTGLPHYGPGDVVGVAVDLDGRKVYYYVNSVLSATQSLITAAVQYPAVTPCSGAVLTARFSASAQTYAPPTGYSAWDAAAAPTSVTIDTLRATTTAASATIDTTRILSGPATVSIDTARTLRLTHTVTVDTSRRAFGPAAVSIDTIRRASSTVSVPADTSRRRVTAFGASGLERMTISLQSGVLADSYQIDQLFDEPLNTAHFGNLYGWPIGCTVRAKSYNPATGRYSLSGDYDISEKLKKYLACTATDAAAVMTKAAEQLGKTTVIATDNHSINSMGDNITVMQALGNLFGWTSAIPHQFVNVFQRGGVLNVVQRGKESSTYVPVKYNIQSLTEKIIDTLMNESDDTPTIAGDPPDAETEDLYYTGSFAFGGAVLTFANGLNVRTVTGGSGAGSTDIQNTYSDKLITRTTSMFYGATPDENREDVTAYSYNDYEGLPYTSTVSTTSKVGGALKGESETHYFPLGFEKYGVEETVWTVSTDPVTNVVKRTVSSNRTHIAEGRPGGEASPWSHAKATRNVTRTTAPISKNPLSSSYVSATDATTLQRYAAGLEWLDGRTEHGLKMECYDSHIVDFDATVTIMGAVWYLQSNSITIAAGGVRQSLDLVRWA